MSVPVQATKRLTKEYVKIKESPPEYIIAKPRESNILEWHYVITGPPDCPYAGGEYHGMILFPKEYPFKPPGIQMLTPNGRFQPGARICLSISDYHPETWNPSWYISTILVGLLSFMLESTHSAGCIPTTNELKKALAKTSRAHNRRNPVFREVFPELIEPVVAPKVIGDVRRKRPQEPIVIEDPVDRRSKNKAVIVIDDSPPKKKLAIQDEVIIID
ncbi:ubiquitin-conjugating enzyme/RWD-like protein [Gorgonomyces haynaldii]|nr:ubiquitin-conjugating enzyme/RWD-like protein [Gorgonomyces haynaldii]